MLDRVRNVQWDAQVKESEHEEGPKLLAADVNSVRHALVVDDLTYKNGNPGDFIKLVDVSTLTQDFIIAATGFADKLKNNLETLSQKLSSLLKKSQINFDQAVYQPVLKALEALYGLRTLITTENSFDDILKNVRATLDHVQSSRSLYTDSWSEGTGGRTYTVMDSNERLSTGMINHHVLNTGLANLVRDKQYSSSDIGVRFVGYRVKQLFEALDEISKLVNVENSRAYQRPEPKIVDLFDELVPLAEEHTSSIVQLMQQAAKEQASID